VLPAVDAAIFSLGLVPADNVIFSTGLHLIRSDTPTFQVYSHLLTDRFFQDDLRLTSTVTLASVCIVVVVSYTLALFIRFGSPSLSAAVRSLYLIPMFVPVVIASYALITLYVDHGLLQALLLPLGITYTAPTYHASGIILGEVWTSIPFAVLMLSSGLDGISAEMIDAARDAGAGFSQVVWRVVLPLNVVPTLIVVTFTFIGVLGSFTVPYLLGPNAPQMVGVSMNSYFGTYQQPQPAVAIAVLTFVVASVAGTAYVWATSRAGRAAG